MSVFRVGSNKSSVNNFPSVRPTLDLDFANSKTLDPRITFTRSSGGTYVGADGLIKYAGVNEARFDHDPSTGESLGLLVEEGRTNLITYSEDFRDFDTLSTWANFGVDITPNAEISPDGTQTASKAVNTAGVGLRRVGTPAITVSIGEVYTYSIWIKAGEYKYATVFSDTTAVVGNYANQNSIINLVTGEITGTISFPITVIPYPNGWWKISSTVTIDINATIHGIMAIAPNTDSNGVNNAIGDGTSGIYVWGAQLEAGAFPTSYIPTEGSTRTRAKELVYIPNVDRTDWYNKAEGTISFEHTTVPVSVSAPEGYPSFGFANTTLGSSDQSIQYFITSRFPNAAFLVRDLVTQRGSIPLDQVTINIPSPANIGAKVSFAYKFNDFGVARNGIFIGRDNTGVVPNNSYMLIIGQNNISANQQLNAHCKYLKYYPKRLPNAQLQALTK